MPRYIKYLVALAIPIQIVRWLLGSIWGVLILSVVLYYLVQRLDWIDTFGFTDLALWFDSLPQASKSTIGAAMLTVVGFLIAFQLSYRNTTSRLLKNSVFLQPVDRYRDVPSFSMAISH